jgi:hypothetical protein
MTLLGNGKSDVRNHLSTDRKSNLHLVSTKTQPGAAEPPQENAEIAKANVLESGATAASQSAVVSSETPVPAAVNEQTISETTKS